MNMEEGNVKDLFLALKTMMEAEDGNVKGLFCPSLFCALQAMMKMENVNVKNPYLVLLHQLNHL